MNNRLLVKTADKRRFLVPEKNMGSIIEFIKTFHAEVYLVEVIDGKTILTLKDLAGAICNPDHNTDMTINIIEKIYPISRNRDSLLNNAKKMKNFIYEQLNNGCIVSMRDLKEKYKNYNITDACICKHLSVVRKELSKNGKNIIKIGQGKYCLQK